MREGPRRSGPALSRAIPISEWQSRRWKPKEEHAEERRLKRWTWTLGLGLRLKPGLGLQLGLGLGLGLGHLWVWAELQGLEQRWPCWSQQRKTLGHPTS